MSRKTKLGLAGLVLALAASLSLSSVAWSSVRATAQPVRSLGLSQAKAMRNLERHPGYLRGAVCRGMAKRGLSCGVAKPATATGKPLGGRLKLLRAPYYNPKDPVCPFQLATTPVAVFATVTTTGVAICVDTIYAHDQFGYTYTLRLDAKTAFVNLWDYWRGRWYLKGHDTADFGNCSIHPIQYEDGIFIVDAVKVCGASVQVNAGLFPPAGTYKGELMIFDNPAYKQVTDYQSDHFCYFC